jgi:uncharacterized membrane protein
VTREEKDRLVALEKRVAHLESLLEVERPAAPATEPRPPAAEPRPPVFEAAVGLTWISRIGVITIVLALAFFFEYAFERHWITNWGRIVLGWGCGAVSLFFGERFWRSGQRTFAQALTAAGLAFLYLSFWAGFSLFHIIDQAMAFIFMLLTTALAGALALRYDGPAIAAMALISGYGTPFLLGMHPQPLSVLAHSLAVAVFGLGIADRRGWSSTAGIAFMGFWAAYDVWTSPARALILTLPILSAAFLLFLAWPFWQARMRRRPLGLPDLAILALNAAFYFGFSYFLLPAGGRIYGGLFALVVAVVQMGAARLILPYDKRGSTLAAGVAWALLVLAVPIQVAGYRVTIGWALEAAAMVWIGVGLADLRAIYASAVVFILVIGRLLFLDSHMYPNAAAYAPLGNARFLAFTLSAIALWVAAWWISRAQLARPKQYPLLAYVAGHVVLIGGLSLEAVGWAARTSAPANFRNVASTAISVLIAAYAVLLVALGVFQRNAPARLLGMAFIGSVVLKLYLYDVWFLAQFYRMAAFAILGVLLLLMSYFYSRFRNSLETWWRP